MNTLFLNVTQSEIYIPTPFAGLYHIAPIVYTNAHDENPLSDIISQDLVSVLQDLETLNSYYELDIINITRLSNNQLLGTLIYNKRPGPIYPKDYNNPNITSKILEHIVLKELPLIETISGTYTIPITSITKDTEAPKVLTVNITFY